MRRKILVADDSVTVRKVIELTFSDGDFDIVSVADGSVALERAKGDRPDIIISDVGMPGLDGYELCRRVKSDPQLQSVPFLFLKGSFESFDEDRAGRCGADGFIVKPFESQEMIRRVTQMIGAAPAPPPAPPHAAPAAVEEPLTPPAPIAEPTATLPPPTIAPAIPEPPPPPPRFPEDDFVHALGIDDEDLTPPRAAPHGATAAPGTTGTEAEEDLWSEVSLRDRPAPVLGGQGEEDTLWESEPVNLLDETVEPAEEEVFEEISTARRETPAPAPPRQEAAPPVAAPGPAPVAPPAPEAPSSAPELTREDLERLIAARLDPLLRDILPSLLGESARRVIDEVAWEVVPDLAEAMIRREIERIKRSAGRG